ncbi:MAG: DNA-binding response regulator [SAR86 cluster bacterium]|uniref:Phosphate regulon transcriptional regulatory protein PhoB n=1 Tax=SAR86 cluster bacterium TaxID=2030880 RepID=A0A2A5B479_9GAMM|nr:MAG: DNA-binding response regulator [SAR86 cluster bacterium]
MANILILEDDIDLSSLICSHLLSMNYQVDVCDNGATGLKQAQAHEYELIILDLGLPGMDGLDVCKTYRQSNELTPILMLTARDTEIDKVIGLEMGADDYLGKPFSIRELQARVKAILRRQNLLLQARQSNNTEDIISCRGLLINPAKRLVTCKDKSVNLTAKEFDLLYFLSSNPGKVYSREQLLDQIWGYTNSYYEHTVNSNINRLRAKIENDLSQPKYIITLRGIGYKFDEAMICKNEAVL